MAVVMELNSTVHSKFILCKILILSLLILFYIYSCCNSCESVLEAYRVKKWNVQLDKIEQCKDQYKRSDADAFKEGCRIQGHLEVNRVSMYIYNCVGIR